MILVGQYDSPFVRRVAVTLHLYGKPFTRNPISVFTNAAEMGRINPLVRIPSLILDDGEVLIDSAAILDYLDETVDPSKALTPRSGAGRRRVMQLTALATGAIDKAGAIVYERHFHTGAQVNADWVARCKSQLSGALRSLDARLGSDWFVGSKLSQADVTTAVMMGYLKLRLPEALSRPGYPKLERLAAVCEMMDAFAACRPGPDEVMPPRGA